MYPVDGYIDPALQEHDELWAAAGTPDSVFPLTFDELLRLSGGVVASFTE
jgi:prolyl-tRNA editing enzyme YbaK/EbsC (Cys-tRNA(Pro) deacylase)